MTISRKVMSFVVLVVIIGGTLAMSKANDVLILTRVGKVTSEKLSNALPESEQVFGPLNTIRASNVMPVSERVRLRISTDKGMEGTRIVVHADGQTVKLTGEVRTSSQRIRAVELAQSTDGVDRVVNEIQESSR